MNRLPSPQKTAYFLIGSLSVILLLSLFGILHIVWISSGHSGDKIIEIYQNGERIQSIALSQVSETYTFTVSGEDGAYNTVEVSPAGVRILEASCPDKLCVHQGTLPGSLLPITCLPNRLVIRLTDTGRTEPLGTADALTY